MKPETAIAVSKLLSGGIAETMNLVRREALLDAIDAIRAACKPCEGTGVGRVFVSAGPDPYEEAEECEYCGRPIAAVRALPGAEGR